MNKRIIISVTSDLSTDQRVHRAALTLHNNGYKVLVVGRKLPGSFDLNRPYATKRFKLPFNKGFLFYAFYNLFLFWFLVFEKAEILLSNDLDTLLPNFLVSKLKGSKLVFDSHEYFTGVPELQGRPLQYNIWKSIERFIMPRLKSVYTVNDSIANLFNEEYKIKAGVIRNVPYAITNKVTHKNALIEQLQLPTDKFIFILQGNGINVQRGAEEAVLAMQYVEDAILLIAGSGDVIDVLKKMVSEKNLTEKVLFKTRMPYQELMLYTQCADCGLTLDKNTNINYRFSLPNKLFDYIQCGIPVLASDLVEVRKIIEQYNFGLIVRHTDPLEIAKCMEEIIKDDYKQRLWKENLKPAATELCWEKEQSKLIEIFRSIAN